MSLFSIIPLAQVASLQGSYRGIGFAYDLGEDEVGRRIEAEMFPGQDITDFQDLGQFDGDIVVHGIISGDDYAAQATRLRAAFQTAGPATLVHPWLGTFQVIQSPRHFVKWDFKAAELRIARFTATFRRYTPLPKTPPDSLQALLFALEDMRTAAYAMLSSVLAPVALGMTVISQVESLIGEVASVLGSLITACASPQVGLAGNLPIGLMSSIASAPFDATYATTVGSLLSAPTAAIAGTTTPAIPSAVAPGGATTTPTPVDGRITATLILAASSQIGAATLSTAPIVIPPGPSLILSAQMFMLADATSAASAITFTSQQDAITWRETIAKAIDVATLSAAALVPGNPAPGAGLWRTLVAAKSAWLVDMNAVIGRLPAVETFTPPSAAAVWIYAQYLAGDDPSAIFATWRDLIARNDIVHPSIPGPGPFETLANGKLPSSASSVTTAEMAAWPAS
jgi:hypothetical protein